MDQLDGKPWGNLDFAGSSVGAVKGQRRHGAAVAFGLTLDLIVCNLVLKPLIGRLRPFVERPDVVLLIPRGCLISLLVTRQPLFAAVFALKASGSLCGSRPCSGLC